jgi:hypothetical protein
VRTRRGLGISFFRPFVRLDALTLEEYHFRFVFAHNLWECVGVYRIPVPRPRHPLSLLL